jgi:hypothetical protein
MDRAGHFMPESSPSIDLAPASSWRMPTHSIALWPGANHETMISSALVEAALIRPRIASNTTLNWWSYLLSKAASLRAKSSCVATACGRR